MERTVIQTIASTIDAAHNCDRSGNAEWSAKHRERLETIARECLPSGSGFDSGTTIDLDASKPNRVVIRTSFHHMTEHGYYDGWSEHDVIVTPDLAFGFSIRVTGRDRDDIKDYIGQTFHEALSGRCTQ